jgi:hypothetical protein
MDANEKMYVISNSSDSRLKSFNYHSGKILLDFINNNDERYRVFVETTSLQTTLQEVLDNVNYTFSISMVELSNFLSVENGIYVPPREFVAFMRNVRDGFSLAYGLRQSKYSILLSFEGDFTLHCVVKNILSINFQRL